MWKGCENIQIQKNFSIFPLLNKIKIILGRDFASNQYLCGYALKDGEWEKDLANELSNWQNAMLACICRRRPEHKES